MTRGLILVLLLASAGCATLGRPPSERIIGEWRSEIGGYPVVVTYGASTVTVAGSEPVSYTLTGNELRYPGGGSQRRLVSFPARNEMLLTDSLTGTAQRFVRID